MSVLGCIREGKHVCFAGLRMICRRLSTKMLILLVLYFRRISIDDQLLIQLLLQNIRLERLRFQLYKS